ncbi:hypothetical protein CPB83DRAFT_914447 [Crepidotus variabilis]|uniref:N-acetyltransferase domain-containing protein n=1 Tax=Crepidotus variabilis TaxID=179855 RepID=A0A9P6ELG1_9AGAR|nr:hypothetical protein CPB83DRAFT_914447 [Crepidotus variabilis]
MSKSDAVAKIRPYTASDQKLVRFKLGQSNMEALANANNKTYFHPLTLAVWVALSGAFIQMMQWWPSSQYGILSYLKPLPAFASTAVPVMFFVDWINRPYFEGLTQEVMRRPDVRDIEKHYFHDPASGFWLLEFGDKYIGLIAVDASQPSSKDKRNAAKANGKTPKTATIRHFHVDDEFRKANVQQDLLDYAVDHAFNKDPKLERIEVPDSPLIPYTRPTLRDKGFELDHHTQTVGILGWKMGTRYLKREKWSDSKKQ